MTELYEKSLRKLELDNVLAQLADCANSEDGKDRCRALLPLDDAEEIRLLQQQTTAACGMIVRKGAPGFHELKPVAASLERADRGGCLTPVELLRIAGVLRCIRNVKAYYSEDGEPTVLDVYFQELSPNRYLEEKITNSILSEEEIADAASSELADIRRHMRIQSAKVKDSLQKIISSPSFSKYLRDPIITLRGDRYVVPVKSEYKSEIPGLVHDVSSTGSTFFIEPMSAVNANNALRELLIREKKEIERILAALSAEAASFREGICHSYEMLVQLDCIFARARLSHKMDGMEPEIRTNASLELVRARHPLLDKDKAVPIDVELGEDYDTLVITGPNTGGKTVTLKTIGLLCLMAQCGLHIPAAEDSCVPIFDKILADIGDEQSIEQSLSTFSAHMVNIVNVLKECGDGSLLLFDELGAGTDPVEGAALAVSILEDARARGCVIAATTHYAELKVYATNTPGVMNASCEFDVDTLRPTYRLLLGIPGKSNAFAISRRLGLPEEIIEDAKGRVGMTSAKLEETIEKLEQTRQILDRERTESARQLRQAEEERKKAAQLRAELEIRLEKSEQKARREAERILADARAVAESTFRELDAMRSAQNEENDHQRINAARAEMRRKLNETQDSLRKDEPAPEEKKSARAVQVGDVVQIRSMGVKATVLAISSDRTLTLQAGILRVTAREDEVLLLENEKPAVTVRTESRGTALRQSAVSSELDIRGMETIEAIPVVERYIDSAVQSRLETVTIIHGKGTGALRAAVQQSLRRNKQVKSFRLGRYGEGETGVTVVELK